ncbi:30S ribosomal protein S3 [Candidatus Altiarchaeota archaeon]
MAMERHFIQEGVIRSEIVSYLKSELNRAGYSGISIQKTPLATRIVLFVEKPPIVIGKKGRRINKLTSVLVEKYGVDHPVIDVQKIEKPTLDPNIIARRIAVALERGMNRRRIVYKALRAVMSSGARGIEIVLSGKLVGKGGRSRTEKYLQGYMKKAGDSLKLVDFGSTQAYLKAGVIGVTVKIVGPDVRFPDQISVLTKEELAIKQKAAEELAAQKLVQEEEEKKNKKKGRKDSKKGRKRAAPKAKPKEKPVKEPEAEPVTKPEAKADKEPAPEPVKEPEAKAEKGSEEASAPVAIEESVKEAESVPPKQLEDTKTA